MDECLGLDALCRSPQSPGEPAELEIISTVTNKIQASRACIKKMLHNDVSQKKDWAKIKGSRTYTMHPAQRRITAKRHKNKQRSFRDIPSSDEPHYGDDFSSAISADVQDDLDEFDRQFYEKCRLAREARDEDDKLNAFFASEYACCSITEVADDGFYNIPEEYSEFPEPTISFGDVLMEREEQTHAEEMRRETSRENLSYNNLLLVTNHHRARTSSDDSIPPSSDDPIPLSEADSNLLKNFTRRQTKLVDFTGFSHPARSKCIEPLESSDSCCGGVSIRPSCGSTLALGEEEDQTSISEVTDAFPDLPEKLDFEKLCNARVQIPSQPESKRMKIPYRTARDMLKKESIQHGTVLYSPQGTGKTYVSRNFPLALDSSLLPISFQNKESLRKLADSGFIVMTSRLRDCDENTVYLVPDVYRFVSNTVSRSLKTVDAAYTEYQTLKDLRAVKFKMRRNQGVADFLSYRMVVYKRCG